jgi:diguanylate cyclase (GGDEF)-like protein
MLLLTGLAGVVTAFAANLARPDDYTHFATVDVVLIFGAYTLLPIPLAARGLLALLVTLGDVALFAGLKSPVPPMAAAGSALGLAAGNALGYLVSSRVNAYRRQQYLSRLELERQASRDDLTGALNRRAFIERAGEELARARLLARPLALVLIDLDHFKEVNDRHGHLVGDQALRALGGQLDELRREGDVFARLGGEEFALLLPDTAIAGAVAAGERIRLAAAMCHAREDGSPVPLSVSVGVAEADDGEDGVAPLLARADRALYAAKAAGRNRVVADASAPRAGGLDPAAELPSALAPEEPGEGAASGG